MTDVDRCGRAAISAAMDFDRDLYISSCGEIWIYIGRGKGMGGDNEGGLQGGEKGGNKKGWGGIKKIGGGVYKKIQGRIKK